MSSRMPGSVQRGMSSELPIHVLNPGGKDQPISYQGGVPSPSPLQHPPVNYHAYAACSGGSFLNSSKEVPDNSAVILLLRPRHLGAAVGHLQTLRQRGCKVAVAWKESGWSQVAEGLSRPGRWQAFRELGKSGASYLAATSDIEPLFVAAGFGQGGVIPTPYPVGLAGWDFSDVDDPQGVFIGTREFDVPSRNHLLAIVLAAHLSPEITIINTSGGKGRRSLKELVPSARIVDGPLAYPDYLYLMARHRIVFQLDQSRVPGQVAGDALLCGRPCIGGNGMIEKLVFPDLCSETKSPQELLLAAETLLKEDCAWGACVEAFTRRARSRVSYQAVSAELRNFFEGQTS